MKPLVDRKYMLEKFPGKGGWTFVRIPHISKDQKIKKVRGTIDGFEIRKYHLMWGEGKVFIPVRAEIRKAIKKEAGDYVKVILFPDNEPLKIPKEMIVCLKDEPLHGSSLHHFRKVNRSIICSGYILPKEKRQKLAGSLKQ